MSHEYVLCHLGNVLVYAKGREPLYSLTVASTLLCERKTLCAQWMHFSIHRGQQTCKKIKIKIKDSMQGFIL